MENEIREVEEEESGALVGKVEKEALSTAIIQVVSHQICTSEPVLTKSSEHNLKLEEVQKALRQCLQLGGLHGVELRNFIVDLGSENNPSDFSRQLAISSIEAVQANRDSSSISDQQIENLQREIGSRLRQALGELGIQFTK